MISSETPGKSRRIADTPAGRRYIDVFPSAVSFLFGRRFGFPSSSVGSGVLRGSSATPRLETPPRGKSPGEPAVFPTVGETRRFPHSRGNPPFFRFSGEPAAGEVAAPRFLLALLVTTTRKTHPTRNSPVLIWDGLFVRVVSSVSALGVFLIYIFQQHQKPGVKYISSSRYPRFCVHTMRPNEIIINSYSHCSV